MTKPTSQDIVRLQTGEAVFGQIEDGPDQRFLYLRRRDGLRLIPLVSISQVVRAQP